MAAQQSSPISDNESSARKRVCKACDRCRLKKSKCDGSSPCSRCRSDNAICVFGERKKSHDKVYPKGYVEMLEQQQMQLVNGLQELYARIISSRGWEGAPLQNSSNGHPLTHDILERLDALRIDGHVDSARFEEDPEVLQKRLISEGALSMQRQDSIDSDSAHDQVSLREDTSPKPFFTDTFPPLNIQFPPTPPVHSPAAAFTSSPTYVNAELMESAQLQSRQQTWPHPVVTFDQSMGFVTSAPASIYEDPSQIQQHANPCLPASPWVDEDEFRLFGLNNMQNIR